ncbi:MAG: HAD family hydrolase [Ilumatobacteraceae bacterium]
MTERAWLIDVYETTLTIEFSVIWEEFGRLSGVAPKVLRHAADDLAPEVMVGRRTFRGALETAFLRCGVTADDRLLDEMMAADRRLLRDLTHVHEDAADLLARIRAAGEPVAFVSNCDDNTRQLLVDLGLADQVDALVLSHEVGSAKPDAVIYERALAVLDVPRESAVLVDDQASFCAAALALGIGAVQIARADRPATAPETPTVVTSLDEVGPGT